MRYAKLIKNDIVNGEGVCVSLWMQGCSHRCKGCHNPHTWNANGGEEIEEDELTEQILSALTAFGVHRNFSILGGEPLEPYNRPYVASIIEKIAKELPDVKIYLWTGFAYEWLKEQEDGHLKAILNNVNVIIDGLYQEDKKDITLPLRGSSNQRIIRLK